MSVFSRPKSKSRWVESSFAVLMLLSSQAFSDQVDGPTPKDSYLMHQVSSVKELVDEVKHHPFIRNRYARLYHISGAKVEAYMSKNLVLTTLRHNYTHIVYCVTPGGVVFTALETQHKGDKVFALRSGNPILRWACGNPFTPTLPDDLGMVVFTGNANRHQRAIAKVQTFHKPLVLNTESLPVHVASSGPTVIVEKVSSFEATLPPVGSVVNIIEPSVSSASKLLPLAPILGVLPLIPGSGGSNGSSTSPTIDNTGGSGSGQSTSGTTGEGNNNGTTGTSTTGGSLPDQGTTGSTTTTGGFTTGGTSTTTTGGSTSTTGSSTSAGTTTTGGPNVTPEPNSLSFWTIAGLLLAFAAAWKRRHPHAEAR